jgi:hypothetical protein
LNTSISSCKNKSKIRRNMLKKEWKKNLFKNKIPNAKRLFCATKLSNWEPKSLSLGNFLAFHKITNSFHILSLNNFYSANMQEWVNIWSFSINQSVTISNQLLVLIINQLS